MTTANSAEPQALSLDLSLENPLAAKLFLLARRPVERILQLERIRSLYGCISGLSPGNAFLQDALDALVLVDLTRTEPHLLARYMGKGETKSFLRAHRSRGKAQCA